MNCALYRRWEMLSVPEVWFVAYFHRTNSILKEVLYLYLIQKKRIRHAIPLCNRLFIIHLAHETKCSSLFLVTNLTESPWYCNCSKEKAVTTCQSVFEKVVSVVYGEFQIMGLWPEWTPTSQRCLIWCFLVALWSGDFWFFACKMGRIRTCYGCNKKCYDIKPVSAELYIERTWPGQKELRLCWECWQETVWGAVIWLLMLLKSKTNHLKT